MSSGGGASDPYADAAGLTLRLHYDRGVTDDDPGVSAWTDTETGGGISFTAAGAARPVFLDGVGIQWVAANQMESASVLSAILAADAWTVWARVRPDTANNAGIIQDSAGNWTVEARSVDTVRTRQFGNGVYATATGFPVGSWYTITAYYGSGQIAIRRDSETPVTATQTNIGDLTKVIRLGTATSTFTLSSLVVSNVLETEAVRGAIAAALV